MSLWKPAAATPSGSSPSPASSMASPRSRSGRAIVRGFPGRALAVERSVSDRASPSRRAVTGDRSMLDGCFGIVGALVLADLAVGLVARDAVTFLNLADKLVALALDHRPVALGDLAPLHLGCADELL